MTTTGAPSILTRLHEAHCTKAGVTWDNAVAAVRRRLGDRDETIRQLALELLALPPCAFTRAFGLDRKRCQVPWHVLEGATEHVSRMAGVAQFIRYDLLDDGFAMERWMRYSTNDFLWRDCPVGTPRAVHYIHVGSVPGALRLTVSRALEITNEAREAARCGREQMRAWDTEAAASADEEADHWRAFAEALAAAPPTAAQPGRRP